MNGLKGFHSKYGTKSAYWEIAGKRKRLRIKIMERCGTVVLDLRKCILLCYFLDKISCRNDAKNYKKEWNRNEWEKPSTEHQRIWPNSGESVFNHFHCNHNKIITGFNILSWSMIVIKILKRSAALLQFSTSEALFFSRKSCQYQLETFSNKRKHFLRKSLEISAKLAKCIDK